MCIIAIKKSGIDLPKEEYLRNCESKNNDGMGVMLLKDGDNKILIKKDFDTLDILLVWLKENVKKEDSCIIHFRFATHGLKDKGNRHPFPITKDRELLRVTELNCDIGMAHNGVISDYKHHETFSDTQKFILDILSDEVIIKNFESNTVRKLIGNFIGNDRLVVLSKDNTIYLFGEWIECEGILYSNKGYSFYYKKPIIYGSLYDDWEGYDNQRWIGFRKETINKDLNSSISKKFNKEKDPIELAETKGFLGQCESCSKRTWLKYTKYNNIGFALCKHCRKKINKEMRKKEKAFLLENKNNGDSKTNEESHICQSCNLYSAKPLVFYGGQHICEDCELEFKNLTQFDN